MTRPHYDGHRLVNVPVEVSTDGSTVVVTAATVTLGLSPDAAERLAAELARFAARATRER